MTKSILSGVAIALTIALVVPYIRLILRGAVRPHVFSWIIWGVGTVVVFFAQLADGAGLGAWPIGLSGVLTSYVAYLAWRHRGDMHLTPTDWVCLVLGLSALPFWFVTSDPLWAVVVLTLVDLMGFGPTLRRAWGHPREKSASLYAWYGLRNGLAVAALEHYSPTTVLFPAVVGLACLAVPIVLLTRRRIIDQDARGNDESVAPASGPITRTPGPT